MSALREPLCPLCGSQLPLRALWKFARFENSRVLPGFELLNRSGLLRGQIGIACPNCGAKFKVVQTRIRVVRFATWALLFAAAAVFGEWSRRTGFAQNPRVELIAVAVIVSITFLLQRLSTPYLAQVRPVRDDEQLSYPLRSAYEGPQDGNI